MVRLPAHLRPGLQRVAVGIDPAHPSVAGVVRVMVEEGLIVRFGSEIDVVDGPTSRAVPDQPLRERPTEEPQVSAVDDRDVACAHPKAERKHLGYASRCGVCGQIVR